MRILYLGDIHGNFNLINQYLKRFYIKDAYIIQVGDFGVGFNGLIKEKRTLEFVHTELVKRNVILYTIRGNHDYKPYFDNDPFGFTNIKLLKDYTVLNLEGKNILCIGGAVSIDRKMRKTKNQAIGRYDVKTGNESWWPDEIFNWEDDKLVDLRDINIVVTHNAPDYCVPDNSNGFGDFVYQFIAADPALKMDLLDERRLITMAFQTIKMYNNVTHHYYGHFHRSDLTTIDGIQHRVLGVGELWEEREYEE
jgi:predicted phosphodiesterase